MRRSYLYSVTSLSCGASLLATTVFALPTDMGRSADVYANAVRYFAAQAGDAMAEGPKARPSVGAETLTYASAEAPAGEEIFSVSLEPRDLATVNFAGAMEDEMSKVSLTPHTLSDSRVAAVMEDILDTVPLEPQLLTETRIAAVIEDEVFKEPLVARDLSTINFAAVLEDEAFKSPLVPRDIASLAVQPVTHDDAFEVPLTPVKLASLNVPEVLMTEEFLAALAAEATPGTEEVIQAAFGTAPLQATAGSSRNIDASTAELTPVAGGTAAPKLSEGFMDEMAAADSNFTIREGAEGRPDTMMMSSDVLFAFGKAALAPEAEATLTTMTDMFASVSKVEVFGHTDAIGSESNNLALGQKRAEVVRDWLLANSTLSPEQIIATGVGEVDPVAANFTDTGEDNPTGRAQNRRVEFAFW